MKLKGKAKAEFLRRMARGRKKHGRKHASKTMSRRHRRKGESTMKRRHHKSKRTTHRKRRSSHGGGFGKYIPDQPKLVAIGTAFMYGKVEGAASKDPGHALNKVPAIIGQIGRAGNLGAAAWLAGVVTRHPIVKAAAAGLLTVAAYQNGRGAGFSKDSPDFKMGAHAPGRGRDEMLVEKYLRQRGAD